MKRDYASKTSIKLAALLIVFLFSVNTLHAGETHVPCSKVTSVQPSLTKNTSSNVEGIPADDIVTFTIDNQVGTLNCDRYVIRRKTIETPDEYWDGYDLRKKLLVSAFLSGKPIKISYEDTDCWQGVRQVIAFEAFANDAACN